MRSTILALGLMSTIGLGACANTQAEPVTQAALPVVEATASGTFTGASNHITTGGASIFTENGKWFVRLEQDFAFDGAPDPKVALGNDGFDETTLLGALQSDDGAQIYEIPASLDVADFNEVWIWCEQFSVPLGVAELSLT